MSSTQQLPKPEQLVDLVSHGAAIHLAMTGAFDDKIAELKNAQAALADATSIAQTIDQAQKIKDDADTYAAAALAKAKDALAKAQDATDKVSSREALVMAREQAVASRESAADSRQDTQDRREQAILDAQNARDASLSAREQTVKNAEADVVAKAKKLATDQAAFNQRLDALRV